MKRNKNKITYLRLSDWLKTGTTTKAEWVPESTHRAQVMAKTNFTVAAYTDPASDIYQYDSVR